MTWLIAEQLTDPVRFYEQGDSGITQIFTAEIKENADLNLRFFLIEIPQACAFSFPS